MLGYVLMLLGSLAVLSAFVFRSPVFVGINRHSVEVWLLCARRGALSFSIGALAGFRSAN